MEKDQISSIKRHIENYKSQQEVAQARVHMLTGAIQALEGILEELNDTRPIGVAKPPVKSGDDNV